MTKRSAALLVPVAASTLVLGACGSKTDSSTSTATTTTAASAGSTAGTTSGSTAGSTASAAAAQCPTSNTRAFAKTRFVADVGLAAGTFHRYIYKPYQAGSFAKGADHRTTTLVKAGAVALVDTKLVDNAYKNVQASPALCKVLIKPLGQLKDSMGGLRSQVMSGNLGAIATVEQLVKQVETGSAKNGAAISENTDLNAAKSAQSQG